MALAYKLSPRAERDLAEILRYTQKTHGVDARRRYRKLIAAAIRDVAADPSRPGAVQREEIAPNARTYHLRFSAGRFASDVRVKNPRHFLLFRVTDGTLEIGRILYDGMELSRHLPPEYGPGTEL